MSKKKHKSINQWIKALLISILILWIVKNFFYDLTIVKNDKMENTLYKGDVVLINKLYPGPRFPITLINFPFFGDNIPFLTAYKDWIQLPYFRINLGKIKRNDIIVFNYPIESDCPIDKKSIEVKRCIALPGDTLKIHDKQIFINNKMFNSHDKCKYRYRISGKKELDDSFFKAYNIKIWHKVAKNVYDAFVASDIVNKIASDERVKKIQILKNMYLPDKFMKIFPYSPYESWTLDYFGPVIVPKKGSKILLTKKNIYYYKKIIEDYEKQKLEIIGDTIFYINNKRAYYYKFNLDYYFVLDDNRDAGLDSRYWGFLPENHIIGKVSFVLFNADTTINHRFLNKVN